MSLTLFPSAFAIFARVSVVVTVTDPLSRPDIMLLDTCDFLAKSTCDIYIAIYHLPLSNSFNKIEFNILNILCQYFLFKIFDKTDVLLYN